LLAGNTDYQTRWWVIKTEFSKWAGKVYHNPEWMAYSKQKRRESTHYSSGQMT